MPRRFATESQDTAPYKEFLAALCAIAVAVMIGAFLFSPAGY
jgi:hypothetical protein